MQPKDFFCHLVFQEKGFTVTFCRNVVHGSDSPENGKREIGKPYNTFGRHNHKIANILVLKASPISTHLFLFSFLILFLRCW